MHRDMVVNEISRNSNIYALLNSEWNSIADRVGLREKIFSIVYGKDASAVDKRIRRREAEKEAERK